MGELAAQAGRKLLAVGVLVAAAYVIFKLVLGFVAGLVWIAVLVVAVAAVIWALRVLKRRRPESPGAADFHLGSTCCSDPRANHGDPPDAEAESQCRQAEHCEHERHEAGEGQAFARLRAAHLVAPRHAGRVRRAAVGPGVALDDARHVALAACRLTTVGSPLRGCRRLVAAARVTARLPPPGLSPGGLLTGFPPGGVVVVVTPQPEWAGLVCPTPWLESHS